MIISYDDYGFNCGNIDQPFSRSWDQLQEWLNHWGWYMTIHAHIVLVKFKTETKRSMCFFSRKKEKKKNQSYTKSRARMTPNPLHCFFFFIHLVSFILHDKISSIIYNIAFVMVMTLWSEHSFFIIAMTHYHHQSPAILSQIPG